MVSRFLNTIVVLVIAVVVTGAGYYVTGVRQQAEFQRIEDAKKLQELQYAEVEELLAMEAVSEEAADKIVRKWRARYKYIPETMLTPDIVQYLESLTQSGFEAFNISLVGITSRAPDYQYYTFDVEGTALYTSLYDFVWHIENNREFYRINDLSVDYTPVMDTNPETGNQKRLDMVRFSLVLDAYFEGAEGLSANREELVPVPGELLPARAPAVNTFLPLVRMDLPPNDRNLPEFEGARLLSIAGSTFVMEDKFGKHTLAAGDSVYLGTVTLVDPVNVRVQARLNKGGIIETVELKLEVEQQPYEQAKGDARLRPIERQ